MDNIKFEDFKNICRICMFTCDLKPIQQNSVIINVLNNLTGVPFETNDDLPQQICLNCFKKINEIHAFTLQCKQTYYSLKKCTDNSKTNKTIEVEDCTDSPEVILPVKEEAMEEEQMNTEQEITNDDSNYLINIKNLNCLEEMLLPNNTENIEAENDGNSNNNDLNEDSSFNIENTNMLEFENTASISNTQLLQEIHEKQSLILFRLECIDKKVHESVKSTTTELSVLPTNLRVKIPLKNMKNFEDFEQYLSSRENMVAMLKYFKVFTSLNVGQSVVNLLKQLLTDELAQNFNFCGKKPKRKFSCTNTEKLIFYTVKSTANCNRDKEYFVSIMNWLKHAPARSKNNAGKHVIDNKPLI